MFRIYTERNFYCYEMIRHFKLINSFLLLNLLFISSMRSFIIVLRIVNDIQRIKIVFKLDFFVSFFLIMAKRKINFKT